MPLLEERHRFCSYSIGFLHAFSPSFIMCAVITFLGMPAYPPWRVQCYYFIYSYLRTSLEALLVYDPVTEYGQGHGKLHYHGVYSEKAIIPLHLLATLI